jgi:GT2 family glycosyltransferase
MAEREQNGGIVLVIVLYKCELEQSRTYLSLIKPTDWPAGTELFVYDNSPNPVEPHPGSLPNVHFTYVADPANGGVSAAYNKAAAYALKKDKKWMLLLDQDTVFPENTFSVYQDAIQNYPEEKLFAPLMLAEQGKLISPCYFRFMRGFSPRHVDTGINSLSKFSLINCGMCIDIQAFLNNHGYDEKVKLDFADHDFIRRFRKSQGERFVVLDLEVAHQLSSEGRNNAGSDLIRFDHYLNGAKHMSASRSERFLLKINALFRSAKLTVIHRNGAFLAKWFKWI